MKTKPNYVPLIRELSDAQVLEMVENTVQPLKWKISMDDTEIVQHIRNLDNERIGELIRDVAANNRLWSKELPGSV